MKWIIEYLNGIQIVEGNNLFVVDKIEKIKKIYFTDDKNQYGFYRDGLFFINNKTFDFKINISNFEMIPFQNKTVNMIFNQNHQNNKIFSWNIGYELLNDEEKYCYTLSIIYNDEIKFNAKHYVKNELIDERNLKLQ